jgi:hypothetical protein
MRCVKSRCASATREINAILTRLQEAKPSDDAELSFITFQDRLFLGLVQIRRCWAV